MNGDEALHPSHFDALILGPFVLYRDGQPIETAGWQRKVQTLLRLLLTSSDMRRPRDEISAILWPEANSEAGSRNLRVVLHLLRRGLGPAEGGIILTENGWIALNPVHDWDVDLHRLETLATTPGAGIALLEQAAGYYRGEPLPEDRYEDWAQAIRTRVQRVWRDLCLRLAHLHAATGNDDSSLTWLDRILADDPLDEEALRLLLTALGRLNRRTEALRRYGAFAQRLHAELELTPAPETEAIIAHLRTPSAGAALEGPAQRPHPVIPQYDLPADGRAIGREEELGRILWSLPPIHAAAPRMVMVAGAQGMGKTRLLAEVAARARRTNLLTLAGAGFAREGRLRYGPIRDALADYIEVQPEATLRAVLGPLAADLVGLLPEIRLRLPDIQRLALSGEDRRLVLFLAVTKLLERIAREMPLVLLLDDLHQADPGTLQLLHFIVRRTSHNRLLIVGAYDPDEPTGEDVAGTALDLVDSGWATSLSLAPLALPELALLLADHLRGRCSPDLAERLWADSGGNPLLALRLLSALRAEGRLEHRGGEWHLAGDEGLEAAIIRLH